MEKRRYRIAADGGGTKLIAVLYDEKLNILKTARTQGTNQLFRPPEVVRAEADALAGELLLPEVGRVESVDYSIVGDSSVFLDALRRRAEIGETRGHGEGHVALASAGEAYGIVAQAGTGSDAFLIQPDRREIVGGWGMLLGDEGGGFDIGLHTLRAAIWAEDGRGVPSVLPDMIKKEWNLERLWDMIGRLNGDPDKRAAIAAVSHIASRAALMGDEAALKVYADAARELAVQVLTAARRVDGRFIGPIVTSGGAWKGTAKMFEVFRDEVKKSLPDASVRFPDFEPIVGSVILGLEADMPQLPKPEIMKTLRESFAAFRYALPPDYKE